MIPSLLIASLIAYGNLADAAMHRDMAAVRSMLNQKADVNAPGADGTPALHWVVRVDDLETARLLIQAGANAKMADPPDWASAPGKNPSVQAP